MISMYIELNEIKGKCILLLFNEVVCVKFILNMLNLSKTYVIMLLIHPCISLYIINFCSFIFILKINVYIWNIIISELKDSIKDVIDKRVIAFRDILDNILIPFVNSNIPLVIPSIVSFTLKLVNSMFGTSENIIVYPKIMINVLKELSIEVVNILP